MKRKAGLAPLKTATAPKTRLGRPLLSRDVIAERALEVIDAHGLEELSTRKLARTLGVEAMTLYHHFPTKAALLDAVAEKLTEMIAPPKLGTDALDTFISGAHGLYAVAVEHPRAFSLLATRRANTPAMLAFYDALLAPLLAAGYSPKDAALIFRATGYFTLGAGLARVATFAEEIEGARPLPESAEALASYPSLSVVAPHLTRARVDALFDRGLCALSAGLRAGLTVAGEAPNEPRGGGHRGGGGKKNRK
ncbi:MAG TPA: TetR family transcriptional regulator [Polyangiaceae bacterium]|nr:TetR family transcriptional regulator [Polyangiaceae bacterium]